MMPSMRNTRTAACRRLVRRRRGFGLVEILFAVVITTIAMIGLAGMLLHSARTATLVSIRNARSAIASQQLNRLAAVPYATLDSQAGCVTVSTQPFPHTRCIAVQAINGGVGAKQLRVIIRPVNTRVRADTLYLTRTLGSTVNPVAS